MYKYNRNNCEEAVFDSLAEYVHSDYHANAFDLLSAMTASIPDLRLDDSTSFAEYTGASAASDYSESITLAEEGSVIVEMDLNVAIDMDEHIMTSYMSIYAYDYQIQVNHFLFEAHMEWSINKYPTDDQKKRAAQESYAYFAPIFNEELPRIYEAWGI